MELFTHNMIVPSLQFIAKTTFTAKQFLGYMKLRFHMSLLLSNPDDACFLRTHGCPELEQALAEQGRLRENMISIQRFFEVWTESSMLKLHETEKGGMSFQLTKKRATILRNKLANFTSHTLDISPDCLGFIVCRRTPFSTITTNHERTIASQRACSAFDTTNVLECPPRNGRSMVRSSSEHCQ